jgi:LacI family transcriptional regulator
MDGAGGAVFDGQAMVAVTDQRPTLRTLAAETGLAVATVSRALKDAPDIGAATKARVREAAKRLGYRPNRAGVRLRTGKTNVIALVLWTEADAMNHASRLISSLAGGLRGTAYHLVIMPYFPDEDPMTPVRYLVETGAADGVILNQTTPDDPRVRYLIDNGVPVATHGRTASTAHPSYDFDNAVFGRMCVQALAARGRRNLLLIAPPADQSYAVHMTDGVRAEAAALGLTVDVDRTCTSDDTSPVIEAAVTRRMARTPRPDGIIVGSTTGALAATAGAEAAGLRIGADFDLAAKEAMHFLRHFRREMLVIHEDVGRAGTALAQAIIAAIERPSEPPLQILDRPTELDWE